MNIAVIPARGGSKRIPRKNVRSFHGKPMIAWSIEAALATGLFDHVVVSTDDQEIAEIARPRGAEVPFMRPADLSDDHTGTTDVMAHAVRWAVDSGWSVGAVCCIYATAPFVRESDIRRGMETLTAGSWEFVLSATDFGAPVSRAFRESPAGGIEMIFPEHFETRSQDLPETLHDAAQFYWGRTDAWLEKKKLFDRHTAAVRIPRWRVQDIDTAEDWERAEIAAETILRRPA